MIKHLSELLLLSKELGPKHLVVAYPHDIEILSAIEQARLLGLIIPTLVGDEAKIKELLKSMQIDLSHYNIIHEFDPYMASLKASEIVRDQGDILMKGLLDTSILLKAAIDKESGLRTENRLTHVSLIEIPTYYKLFLMSDAALNIAPDLEIKKSILNNGVALLHHLGLDHPKVGILAAIEKVNPKMPATLDASNLVLYAKESNLSAYVGGPYALDNAFSKESALHKGIKDNISGDVDFVIVPDIEAGNILYKALMFLSSAKSASLVLGAKSPIIVTSRADSSETKLNSIALATLIKK